MLTRREIIIKWMTYAGTCLLLLFLFALLLRDVQVFGARMFLPPLFVGVVASMEDMRAGVIFGTACGLACDLTVAGTFPCVYTLSFTLAALVCAALAKSVLQPGLLCSLAVTAIVFLVTDALNMLALYLRRGAPFGAMAPVALRETAASCLLLAVCHPVLWWLHRKFTL